MPAGSIARATGWEGMQYTATVTLPNRLRQPLCARGVVRRSGGGTMVLQPFSNGPQRCPGDSLAVQLGTVVAATILSVSTPLLLHATLDPDRPLPYTLNPLAFRIRLVPRANPSQTRASTPD
jgi:cytochrome P450